MAPPSALPALTPAETAILRLKALIGPPSNKNAFLDCLNQVTGARPAWTSKSLYPFLERLRRQGLLAEDFSCPPERALTLAIDVLAGPEGADMLAAIKAALAFEKSAAWQADALVPDVLRWQRLAVLTNDDDLATTVTAQFQRRTYRTAPSVFVELFPTLPLDPVWWSGRTPFAQAQILSGKLALWLVRPDRVPDLGALIAACRQAPQGRESMAGHLMLALLMRGELTALDQLATAFGDAVDPVYAQAFAATRHLLQGDVPAAVEGFTGALKAYRKSTRRRKGGLPPLYDLFHAFALLASHDPARHGEIETVLTGAAADGGAVAAVLALAAFARNKKSAAVEMIEQARIVGLTQPEPVLSSACLALAAALINPDLIRGAWKQALPGLFKSVCGSMDLVADILAEALERVAPDPAPYAQWLARPGREVRFRFAALVETKAGWERALDGLSALMAPTPTATATTAKSRRLIWLIDPDTLVIQPVEQTSQARGWSAGRNIALKRLFEADPTIDYLDEHDKRVVASIVRRTEPWRGHNTPIFEFDPDRSLPVLVGHPRLFDQRTPGQRVDLVEGRPELVVTSSARGYRLALSHTADGPGSWIEVEAPDRWRVVMISAAAVEAAAVLGESGLVVPKAGRDRLLALARLAGPDLPVRIEAAGLDDQSAATGDATPVLRLSPVGEGIKVQIIVRPLGAAGPHFLPGLGSRLVVASGQRAQRDFAAEKAAARKLAEACPSLGGEGAGADGRDWLLEDLESSLEFLSELQALPNPPAIEWPEGQKLSLKGTASAKSLKASIKSADAWFDLGGKVAVDEDQVLDLKDLLARMEQATGRFIPLGEGGFLALDRHFRQQLERLGRVGDGLRIPRVAGLAIRDLVEEAGGAKTDARWRDFIGRLDQASAWVPVPNPALQAELRDYQRDGFVWLSRLARWGGGALLADDMGLGKTVQTIAVMLDQQSAGPILVVAPTSVCGNWVAELTRFAPGLTPVRLADSDDREQVAKGLGAGDVLIASYGLLVRTEAALAAVDWAMVVLDEAQAIKNPETQRSKVAARLKAGFRLALTGTPVENDLTELWSLFRFLYPGLLGGRDRFVQRFATPIERDRDPAAKAALKALVRPFLLRRTKAAVLSELPARTEQTLVIEPDAPERAFYEALRRRALDRLSEPDGERTRIHILAELTRLRQACCHPELVTPGAGVGAAKLEAFLDLVEELRLGHHRALVFSQFVGYLEKVRAALDQAGVSYLSLDGSTPAREREQRVAAFQAGEGDLFLISLKAGGFGLNLTAADYVIHLDPWWNPAVEDQASDRAHRIGQERPVTIYRLIMKDSVEEGIVALHRQKRDLADALLEGADAPARLTEDDLIGLIRGS